MDNQKSNERSVMDEVVETLIKKTEILETELKTKTEALLVKERQTQGLLENFDQKFSAIVIQAPKPDVSYINMALKAGLEQINQTMETWPKPIKKEYRFLLFPEHLRSEEYVKIVLNRVFLFVLSLIFIILTYYLLDDKIS